MFIKSNILLVLIFISHTSVAKNAQVSLFLFLHAEPLSQIDVYENQQKIASSDAFGNVLLSLKEGSHDLLFKSQNELIYRHQLHLDADEILQMLIDFKVKGQTPVIDIESSKTTQLESFVKPNSDHETPNKKTISSIEGQLLSEDTHQPIAHAKIFISGITETFSSDEKGRFTIQVPTGSYNISLLHAQFNSVLKTNVQIDEKGITDFNIRLTPAGTELPEFVVVVPFIEGSLASVLAQRKQNSSVANYLSMEQISNSGDSDAAGALKRVTGLTLVDGKFIFVRGLGERYSSTLLNGANLPSPDPTRRVVPLDLFPTGIIKSIEVQKGYAVNLPAEFGGGTVTLKTINIPESSFLKVGLSYKNNTQTTGQLGLTSSGGNYDWTGYDDGSRAIPPLLQQAINGGTELRPSNPFVAGGFAPEELEAIGESLSNNYNLYNETIDPGLGFSSSAGLRKEFDSGLVLGLTSALEYGSDYQTRSELRRDYIVSSGTELALDSEENSNTTRRDINLSGFVTAGIEFNKNHNFSINFMRLRNTQNFNEVAEGFNEDLGNSRKIYELRWTERQLSSTQVFGEHLFKDFNDLKFNWQYTDSTANFDEPDNRIYRYDQREEGDFIFSTRNDSNSRVWRELADLSKDIHYDISLPFEIQDKHAFVVFAGQGWVSKDRNSDIRRFVFEDVGSLVNQINRNDDLQSILSPQYIAANGYQLVEVTRATDNYFASLDIKSSYFNLEYTFKELLKLSLGVRKEDFSQSVSTFNLFDSNADLVTASLNKDDFYPAFSSTLFLPNKNELRFNYSQTATRPDFKELTPAQFKDPVLNRNVIGNPTLITGQIKHYDLRWDHYFSASEFVSVSLFYKKFINPIELIILPGSSRIISFDNAESADNAGIELEIYKDFSFMKQLQQKEFWSDIYISANYAYIQSEITLSKNRPGGQTNNTRPLQGQSPYVFNIQIGYDNKEKEINSSLLFNVFGERISEAGTSGKPDVYEQPFKQLDFVYSQKFLEHFSLSFKAKNLLNDEVLFLVGDETARSFSKGRSFSLGLSYDIY